jgi:thiamine-phosphate pyrophosphorylase
MSNNNQRRLDFSDVALYGITPDLPNTEILLEKVEGLLAGGVDAIQMRSRSLTDRALVEFGKAIKRKCEEFGALFIVDNRTDIALACDADGIHIGHEDLPISFVRGLMGHRKIVGVSTHSLPEALEAQKAGADYVSCGPLWSTPTKPEYKAVGQNLVGLYNAALRIPFVAIGGIDLTNIDQVVSSGAKTVAVVRALFDSENPASAAKQFKSKVNINRPAVAIG